MVVSILLIATSTSAVGVATARTRADAPGVELLATDALIMTGTDMHVVTAQWMDLAIQNFIEPTLGGQYLGDQGTTPEEFWPFGGLFDGSLNASVAAGTAELQTALAAVEKQHAQDGHPNAPIVIFGYSQSALIVTAEKRRLAAEVAAGQTVLPISFVVIGNPARPNGGLNERFAGLRLPGWTFTGATPTDTTFPTVDIARQYDPFADFPLYPLNLLADLNAVMGAFYSHNYAAVTLAPASAAYDPNTVVQQVGDTTYYLIPAQHLPLLQPLRDLGIPARPLDANRAGTAGVRRTGLRPNHSLRTADAGTPDPADQPGQADPRPTGRRPAGRRPAATPSSVDPRHVSGPT